jgi:NADH-quinone oxidoreductase subunit L
MTHGTAMTPCACPRRKMLAMITHHGHDGTAGYHPHESPLNMLVPLIVLSLGAVLAGFLFHGAFIDPEGGAHFWKGALAFDSI